MHMNQKAIVISIALFVVIVCGMFAFAYFKKNEVMQPPSDTSLQTQPKGEVKYASITRIVAKHYYINGVHTLVGEIPMPTPCDLLQTDAAVAESSPEQVTINFSVINNAETCAQQETVQRFKVSATAPENAVFTALFMGRSVVLNLVPAAIGETPDDFELYQKG